MIELCRSHVRTQQCLYRYLLSSDLFNSFVAFIYLYSQFQEFSFQLPNDNEYTHGQGFTNINSLRLRIAVLGNNGEQIDAMSTIEYDELNILVCKTF